jgi:molecular chaperone DnaJ
MAKNYYAILGIQPTASPEDIRGAYRKRAKELHPDHYGDNSSPFIEVQEAYGVLGDPGQRRDYDRRIRNSGIIGIRTRRPDTETLRPVRQRAEPLRGTGYPSRPGGISLFESFRSHSPSMDEIVDRFMDSFNPYPSRKGDRYQNLNLEVLLTPEEARAGGQFRIYVPAARPCPTCGGRGAVEPYPCLRCMGGGAILEDIPVTVEFAPGIFDGYRKAISLERFGARGICLTLVFRTGGYADMEGM